MLQREVDAHPNNPVLRLERERRYHDLGDIVQGSTIVVHVDEATEGEESSSLHPEHAAAGGCRDDDHGEWRALDLENAQF